MARFPLKEAEIVALAEAMITGIGNNGTIYPSPPVIPPDLATFRSTYIIAQNALIAAQAAAEQATADKDDALGFGRGNEKRYPLC